MLKKLQKQTPLPIIAIFVAMLAMWFLSQDSPLLWKLQEMNLYLPTDAYRQSMTRLPGGLLMMAGCWCTEWFYHPWQGIALLALMWVHIGWGIKRLYHLELHNCLLAVLPAIALAACLWQTGYWIYYMKLPGFAFVPTLGTLMAIWIALGVNVLPGNRWFRTAVLVFLTIVLYPIAGFWGLMAVAFAALTGIKEKKDLSVCLAAAAAIAIIPLVFYRTMYSETMINYLWSAAFPSYRMGPDLLYEYLYPYLALALSLVLPIGTKMIHGKRMTEFAVGLLCIAYAFAADSVHYKDTNFDKEILMMKSIDERDFEQVLRIYRERSDMPATRAMVMMKNLSLLRLGRAGDEMFAYPDGGEIQHAPWQVKITQVGGKLMYYEVGKENFCYRWSMEDAVEFGWKVDYMKLMAKSSIVLHDYKVAEKYLRLLAMTRFHKEWAEHYMQYLYNDEKVEKDEEFGFIRGVLPGTNHLDGDNTMVEMYLLQTFSHAMGADKNYAELTLMCAMIMKDIDLFWPRFFRFAEINGDKPMPRYYQEAAYLYGNLEPHKVDISKMPFDDSVKDRYMQFLQFNQQCGPSMTEEAKARVFKPQFGDTFYYFYFLVRNVKTN